MNMTETLDAMQKALLTTEGQEMLRKAGGFSQGTGLINYDLQAPALFLVPWGKDLTPLRYEIPRVGGDGGVATNWRAITGMNTTGVPIGVSEGNRNAVITSTVVTVTKSYVGIGLENNATFEAEYASVNFDSADDRSVQTALRSLMIGEEQMIIGGNASIALGKPGTVVLSAPSTTAGVLSNATYTIGVVALTHDGWGRASVAKGVVQQISRINAEGSTDTINGGTSTPSDTVNITLSGGTSTQNIGMTVPVITGAIAYAWYVGTSTSHQYLVAITTINSYVLNTAVPASTFQDLQSLTPADYSVNVVNGTAYSFDGLLYQGPFAASTGAYFSSQPTGTVGAGTPLTSDGAAGIVELNKMFQSMWDNYRISPDTIWVNSQELSNISAKVIANNGAPLLRLNMDNGTQQATISAGGLVTQILNRFTGMWVKLRIHAYMPPGTILATANAMGSAYAGSGVDNMAEMKVRQDYYQTVWPLRTRKREFGVYADEVLAMRFAPAFGAITNIANG